MKKTTKKSKKPEITVVNQSVLTQPDHPAINPKSKKETAKTAPTKNKIEKTIYYKLVGGGTEYKIHETETPTTVLDPKDYNRNWSRYATDVLEHAKKHGIKDLIFPSFTVARCFGFSLASNRIKQLKPSDAVEKLANQNMYKEFYAMQKKDVVKLK